MIQSIERAMKIIYALQSDTKKESWSIPELVTETELPISTIYRLIDTLMVYDLVAQLPGMKQYKLGYTWMELGLKLYGNLDLRKIARPAMESLASEVGETIYLNIPREHESIIIDRIDSPRSVKVIDMIGEKIPFSIGASNKTMLANMNLNRIEQIFEEQGVGAGERIAWQKLLLDTKEKNYAVSYGEKTKGTIAVASPILGFNHDVIGAISAEFLDYEVSDQRMAFIIEKVKEAAQCISVQLGQAR